MKGINCISKLSIFGQVQLITVIIFLPSLYGQGQEISGRCFKEDGKGKIGPIRVVLYDQNKKKVVELEQPGKFKLKNIPDGKYTMNFYGPDGYGITENFTISGSNKNNFNPSLNPNPDQVQLTIKPDANGASLSWKSISGASNYIIYRDNQEITTVTGSSYFDEVSAGQTFAYNVVVVKTDQSMGTRSITEYGKSLINPPENVTAEAKKNTVKLSWFPVEDATGYAIYRDGEKVNSTADNSYTDFNLKYETEYSYTTSTLDHQSDEGSQSTSLFTATHPEIKKPKGLKAESGANKVTLNWKAAENSIKYYIYQNGALVDSSTSLSGTVQTEAGTENCFTVSGVDKYGSIGPRSDAACDKSVFSPPDSIVVKNDKRNNNLIEWGSVEGASSYNLYANEKLQTNTSKLEINLKSLKWDTDYTYYLTSLTEDGIEGPESKKYTVRTPKIYRIEGVLLDETGDEKNVDQAKVFLYDSSGTKLFEEFVVSRNGKFLFENEIIAGNYTIMVYGNGSGNGGDRVQVINRDITNMKIPLSTEGLRPKVWVERGVGQLTVHWSDIPQAKSYNIYKNDRLINNVIGDTLYTDIVAPGVPTKYMVRSIDLYDLEGPTSNSITEKASYAPPELSITVVAGGYTEEGSGRHIDLSWPEVPGVKKYALYRDNKLLTKQPELTFEERDLKWNTTYIYAINSIDNEDVEGVNFVDTVVTHPEVTAPVFKLEGKVNSIDISWQAIPGMEGKYKIFRDGGNIADLDALGFIDPVNPGIEYCYTVAAEDTHKTVGPEAKIQCAKGYFAPPGNFTGKIMRNSTSFTWESVLGASGYRLYRDNELIFDTADETEFVDNNLKFDTDYNYEICSYDKESDDGPRTSLVLTTHEKVLAIDLTADADLEKISLIWKKSNLRVDHTYRIYRDKELLTEVTDTIYNDIVPAGQFFCYGIHVVDKYGTEGPSSNEECQKVLVNYPRKLQVTGDVKRILFSFKQMVGAVSYNIYQADKESDSLSFLVKTKRTHYEDKGLEFDTEYCYQIASEDQDGDEGPRSPTMCGYVLPPPHLTLIEKKFKESSGNGQLDGRENAWLVFKVVNDGRSPARNLKPILAPIEGLLENGSIKSMTPSLKIDSVSIIPILAVGDTLQVEFPIYAKLKIESGDRNFMFYLKEFSGQDLKPEPMTFKTLKVIPPNLTVTDFAIDNEWGQNYVPINETVTMTVRVQNLSEGLTDTASVKFRRDSSFISHDADELHEFAMIPGGNYLDFSFEILSREANFTVYLELYDYFEIKKEVPLFLETMKTYKGKKDLIVYETPYPKNVVIGQKVEMAELITNIPKSSTKRELIGIVLGNPAFRDSTILGKSSTNENVKQVRKYFNSLFGMKDHEIVPSQYWHFDNGISSNDFKTIFDPGMGYIKEKIISNLEYSGKDTIDLIVYFSGEGTTFNGKKVLLPYDANLTKSTSFYPVEDLYRDLLKLQSMPDVGEITLFMDLDFNNSAFTQNIVKKTDVMDESNKKGKGKKKNKKKGKGKKDEPEEPVVVLPKEIMPPETITAIFASNTNQIAYDHPDFNNSLFTYFLLKGLRGEADNGDKSLTVSELYTYVQKNVEDKTKILYNELPQVPVLFTSKPDRVLYRLP